MGDIKGMQKMIVAQSDGPGQLLKLVEIPVPSIGEGEILVRVKACGVCHSDLHIVDGDWSHEGFPKVPGHEVAGVVEAMAPDVEEVDLGDRVGVPWIHSTCGHCEFCAQHDDPLCPAKTVTGLTVQGGFGEFLKVPARSVTKIPNGISYESAAPLFCAGLTSYSALKLAGVRPGERVAVHGVGGLGHLAVQLAKCMGAHVTALTGSESKREDCLALGADSCLVGDAAAHCAVLKAEGGVNVILSTVPDPTSVGQLTGALARNGRMVIVGAGAGAMSVQPKELIHRRLHIMGSPVGTRSDMRELLDLVVKEGLKVETKLFPLARVNDALEQLRIGEARFRLVLIP